MNRRRFLSVGAAGAFACLPGARGAFAGTAAWPAGTRDTSGPAQDPRAELIGIPYGETRLKLSNDDRDGTLYVPPGYKDGTPMPLLMMLHGFGGTAASVRYTFPLADEFGVIVIAPESRSLTWGQGTPGFDADVRYLGAAYRHVTDILDVDRTHVALGGQSDGAGYALSMGLAYGDVFNHLMIFAGGLMNPLRRKGMPRIFIAHGANDQQMPVDLTARTFAPQLKKEGYDVTYREHEGGHGTPVSIVREAFVWFLGKDPKAQ